MEIYERIFELLGSKRSRQLELAKAIGVSTQTVSSWKTRGSDPSAKLISSIADFLGVSTDYLLTGKESQTKKIEVIPDPELKRMIDILTEIMNDPDPRRRTWATIQFEDTFRSYCTLHDEKKMQA